MKRHGLYFYLIFILRAKTEDKRDSFVDEASNSYQKKKAGC